MATTSYITPAMLTSAPSGISWTVIPTLTANSFEQAAQLAQVCQSATSYVDGYCRQPLRATINTETASGPGQPRVTVSRDTGIASLVTRRWPVTDVSAVQVSQSRNFPPEWTLVPAGQYRIRHPVITSAANGPVTTPSGGNVIDVAPRYITWDYGRAGQQVMTSYTSGWPHAGTTGAALAGDMSLAVDDVTGWAGFTGFAYDGTFTEPVTVTSVAATTPAVLEGIGGTVQAGPGTLTLASPLTSGHDAGTVISALPATVIHAAVLAATVEALEGIDAIAVQSLNGQSVSIGALAEQCELLLDDFRKVA